MPGGAFRYKSKSAGFNLTPIIDIVFLLIIFFLVVCRFIEAENFPVTVPDRCDSAVNDESTGQITTVTVMQGDYGVEYAVAAQKVKYNSTRELVAKLTSLIDAQLASQSSEKRIVNLRIDSKIPFAQAQHALTAVAASTASDIQMAALQEHASP